METTVETNKRRGEKKMRRIIITSILAAIFTCSSVMAKTIIVKVSNVRGEKGNILVMAQQGKDSKPVYGMTKAENGTATVTLENVEWDQFDLSVFHDENDNWKMDFTEDKKPAEGYAMKSCKPKKDEETVSLKMYYPESE